MKPGPLFLGLYSTAEGAQAYLACPDGHCLAESRQDHLDSVVSTARTALEPCLQALDSRDCYACLSLLKYADQLSLDLFPGISKLFLVKPQEALLAGTLGGVPGVVVQSAGVFRGLGVDEEGNLKGLAQEEGGCRWMMEGLRLFGQSWSSEVMEEWMRRVSQGSAYHAGLFYETVTSVTVLLLHLLPQLRLRKGAPISWSGPGMIEPLPSKLAECLERAAPGWQWVKPQTSPAQGCVLLVRAAAQREEQGKIDQRTWKTLFQLSAQGPFFCP